MMYKISYAGKARDGTTRYIAYKANGNIDKQLAFGTYWDAAQAILDDSADDTDAYTEDHGSKVFSTTVGTLRVDVQ